MIGNIMRFQKCVCFASLALISFCGLAVQAQEGLLHHVLGLVGGGAQQVGRVAQERPGIAVEDRLQAAFPRQGRSRSSGLRPLVHLSPPFLL